MDPADRVLAIHASDPVLSFQVEPMELPDDEDSNVQTKDSIAHAWNSMMDSWGVHFPQRLQTISEAPESEDAAAAKLVIKRKKASSSSSHAKKSKPERKAGESRGRSVGFR